MVGRVLRHDGLLVRTAGLCVVDRLGVLPWKRDLAPHRDAVWAARFRRASEISPAPGDSGFGAPSLTIHTGGILPVWMVRVGPWPVDAGRQPARDRRD